LQNRFANPIIYENEQINDFVDLTVKEVYEKLPKIQYPMITIEELINDEDTRYSSNLGEEFSDMNYQINILTRDVPTMQANEAIRVLANEINKILGEEFKMVRQSSSPILPLPNDTTILQYSMRYSCVFDIIRNIIYKD